jgi:hypothetical protein
VVDQKKHKIKTVNACYYWVQNFVSPVCNWGKKIISTRPWRNAILLVVWYGCETLGLILGEERRLGVFENTVLRKTSGPKKDEVKGEWIQLHNEKLCNLYRSPNIIRMIRPRRMRWLGHVACMGERKEAYMFLVGKCEGKRRRGRPGRRWQEKYGDLY